MTARHIRPWCSVCRRAPRNMPVHLSTATHRSATRRAAIATSPAGSHAYSARKAAAASAHRALRNWDDQYAEDDPGNSPGWDAEVNA